MTAQVSPHQIRIFRFLVAAKVEWSTAEDVTRGCDVSGRCARRHLQRMVEEGLAEKQEVFPGYRYRIKGKVPTEVAKRMAQAAQALGIE